MLSRMACWACGSCTRVAGPIGDGTVTSRLIISTMNKYAELPSKQDQTSFSARCRRRAGSACCSPRCPARRRWPGPDDALHLYAGLGYGYDDNLLRVPDGQPGLRQPAAAIPGTWPKRACCSTIPTAASASPPAPRCRRTSSTISSSSTTTARTSRRNWNWQLGNHLEGTLGGTYIETLAPYTDFHSDQRNLRRQRSIYGDGAWRFHPSYRVRAAASQGQVQLRAGSRKASTTAPKMPGKSGVDYLPRQRQRNRPGAAPPDGQLSEPAPARPATGQRRLRPGRDQGQGAVDRQRQHHGAGAGRLGQARATAAAARTPAA